MKKEPRLDNDAHGNCPKSDDDSPNVKHDNREFQVPIACVEVHSDSKVIFCVWFIMSYCLSFSLSLSFVAVYIIGTVRYLIIQKLSLLTSFTFKACYLLHYPVNIEFVLSSESSYGIEAQTGGKPSGLMK